MNKFSRMISVLTVLILLFSAAAVPAAAEYEIIVPEEYKETGTMPVYRAVKNDFMAVLQPEWLNQSGIAEVRGEGAVTFNDLADLVWYPESFSYEKKNMQRIDMSQGHPVVITEDVTYERWLDPECHNVYAGDPDTTDVEKWKAEHRRGVVVDTWSLTVQDFLLRFLPPYSKLPLSIDFIEQKI